MAIHRAPGTLNASTRAEKRRGGYHHHPNAANTEESPEAQRFFLSLSHGMWPLGTALIELGSL